MCLKYYGLIKKMGKSESFYETSGGDNKTAGITAPSLLPTLL